MKSTYIRNRRKGFSLVEIIIYLGILSVLSIGSITFLISLSGFVKEYRVETALYRSTSNVLEQVEATLRQADTFDATSVTNDATNGKLVLKNGAVTTSYIRNGTALELWVGGVNKGNLLNNGVTVTNFTVYKYVTVSGAFVRVRLDLQGTVSGITKSVTLYDSSVIRGDI